MTSSVCIFFLIGMAKNDNFQNPKNIDSMDKILFKRNLCDFCGTCVAVCPHDAIELAEADLEIISERCTACMNCVYICPIRALEAADEK